MRTDRQTVLNIAAKVFATNPRASTQDLAAAAGISRTTLHRLFPSRNALIEELGAMAVDQISAAFAAARLDEGSVVEALERLVEALIPVVHQLVFLTAEPQIYESESLTDADRALQQQSVRLMRRGQAEGSLRADIPAAWLTYALSGLLLAAEEAVRMGDIAPRETSRLILESFLRGAAFRPNDAVNPSSFAQVERKSS